MTTAPTDRCALLGGWYSLFAVLMAAVILLAGCSAARPLHRSEAKIRASLLERTPVGTPRSDVETFVAKQGWHRLDVAPRSGNVQTPIEVYFGEYFICGSWGFAMRGVYGTWGFDSDGRIVDVKVRKANDAL